MDLNKQVKAAQKRLATYIDKLAEKAKVATAKDFAEARKTLNVK